MKVQKLWCHFVKINRDCMQKDSYLYILLVTLHAKQLLIDIKENQFTI